MFFGEKYTVHSAIEQRPELARIKPIVFAVDIGGFSFFLSDTKNVIIYEDGKYCVPEYVENIRDFQNLEFSYKGDKYLFLNNKRTILKNGKKLLTHDSYIWNYEYPLGTDLLGRCFYSRVLVGLKNTALVTFVTMIITHLIGLLYGCLSGCIGGWVDAALTRMLDLLSVIPQLLIVILVSSFINSSVLGVIIALSSVSWVRVARIVRVASLKHKEKEYCKILLKLGASEFWITCKHIIPNMYKFALINTIALLPTIVMSESSLSFLGIGLKYPNFSLGSLCSTSLDYIRDSTYLTYIPVLVLLLFLFAIFLLIQEDKETT